MKTKGYDLDIFSLLHFTIFLISHGHASKGCDLLKEVLQKDVVHSNNMKMIGFINKAVEELSKDGRMYSDIKIIVGKYLLLADQTIHNEDGSK
jgi:hypothetical protein